MLTDPHRSTPGSPDAVLAQARRLAADIRRRAQRDASRIRREAAEWAARTRREAERHRTQVLAEVEREVAARRRDTEEPESAATGEDGPAVVVDPAGAVIDLRSAAEARRLAGTASAGRTETAPGEPDEPDEQEAARQAVHRTFHHRFP